MQILTTIGWEDYELLDTGNGKRLERFGPYTIARPDPQVIWQPKFPSTEWEKADASFDKKWYFKKSLPLKWALRYKGLKFLVKLTPFKHTGVFPEQHLQWDWLKEKINQSQVKQPKVLNLFAYTGIASLVCASAGAAVTHVDASRPTIGWAKENQEVSDLADKPIRWILDDVLKFCSREVRRGNKYDGIILDPPVYGHGPGGGEKWDFSTSFPKLMRICKELLATKPLFILINAYAISSSALMLENILSETVEGGKIEVGELVLQEKSGKRLLSTGIFGRWSEG